jgi:putative hemolysin
MKGNIAGIVMGVVAITVAVGLALIAVSYIPQGSTVSTVPRTISQGEIVTHEQYIEIPNDRMLYCEEQGGGYIIYTPIEGVEQGLCVFEDFVCDADELFAGLCAPSS